MIKPSDIIISEYDAKGTYNPYRVIEAKLEVTSVVSIHPRETGNTELIECAKEQVRHMTYQHLYGDLRDPIEEMYAIAMANRPYSQELYKVRELKGKIDQIMRGGE